MITNAIRWLLGRRLRYEMRCRTEDVDEWIEFNVTTWKRFRELRSYYRSLGFR